MSQKQTGCKIECAHLLANDIVINVASPMMYIIKGPTCYSWA